MSNPSPGPGGTGSGPGDAGPPTCFRHPGRDTYVSRVRCGRPACPDCLRSAAVGQQCVECIRAGNHSTRSARGVCGGRSASRGAVVSWTLVAINIVLYLVELSRPSIADSWEMLGLGSPTGRGPLVGVATGQWYRLITSAFLPPPGVRSLGPLDIIFNAWALTIIGPPLARPLGP